MIFSFSSCHFVILVAAACCLNGRVLAQTAGNPQMTTDDSGGYHYCDAVTLGDAGEFAILAKSGISTVPNSVITGDIGVSPVAAIAMTGFSLRLGVLGQFATSDQVVANPEVSLNHPGRAYGASYGAPISVRLTAAVSAMEAAYTDAAGRVNTDTTRINLGGGILGGVYGGPNNPLTAGVYTFDTPVSIMTDITFSGSDTDVFIVQIAGDLTQAANYNVFLSGGARANNIFWVVAGYVSVGVGAHMEGIILGKTKVDFLTGSSLNGRVLAQMACNLQMATITEPTFTEYMIDPTTCMPTITEPVITEPDITEPVITESDITEPVITEPVITEPIITEPIITEPPIIQPTITQPPTNQPVIRDTETEVRTYCSRYAPDDSYVRVTN